MHPCRAEVPHDATTRKAPRGAKRTSELGVKIPAGSELPTRGTRLWCRSTRGLEQVATGQCPPTALRSHRRNGRQQPKGSMVRVHHGPTTHQSLCERSCSRGSERETQARFAATPRTVLTFTEELTPCQDSLKKLPTKSPQIRSRFSRSCAKNKDLNQRRASHFLFCKRATTFAKCLPAVPANAESSERPKLRRTQARATRSSTPMAAKITGGCGVPAEQAEP